MDHVSLSNMEDALRLVDGIRDPVRIEIIFLLGQNKALNVNDIAGHFNISRPAISHHLKVLKDAKIVNNERIGQEIYYQLNRKRLVAGLRQIADEIENCCMVDSAS